MMKLYLVRGCLVSGTGLLGLFFSAPKWDPNRNMFLWTGMPPNSWFGQPLIQKWLLVPINGAWFHHVHPTVLLGRLLHLWLTNIVTKPALQWVQTKSITDSAWACWNWCHSSTCHTTWALWSLVCEPRALGLEVSAFRKLQAVSAWFDILLANVLFCASNRQIW